jgi:hypothetical protein
MEKTLTEAERKSLNEAMEQAADDAWNSFDIKAANATGDGVKATANWLKANYRQAGYNKLCRRLLTIAD